jgi:hypothetical protein
MRSFGRGRRRAGLMVYFRSHSHFSEAVPSMGHEACERSVVADYAVVVLAPDCLGRSQYLVLGGSNGHIVLLDAKRHTSSRATVTSFSETL